LCLLPCLWRESTASRTPRCYCQRLHNHSQPWGFGNADNDCAGSNPWAPITRKVSRTSNNAGHDGYQHISNCSGVTHFCHHGVHAAQRDAVSHIYALEQQQDWLESHTWRQHGRRKTTQGHAHALPVQIVNYRNETTHRQGKTSLTTYLEHRVDHVHGSGMQVWQNQRGNKTTHQANVNATNDRGSRTHSGG
jgi:hypothetical protein